MADAGHPENGWSEASPWYEWGPYLSERAWGSVREDYSANGDAWNSFPHDHARSRAYRWNEDGMAGRVRRVRTAEPGAGALEREGSDPQGADVRPGQLGGQPRRGRQGLLVVHGRRAERGLAQVAVPLPAGGVPLRGPRLDERSALQAGAGVRAPGHRRLRRRALLGRRGGVRQGVADRHPDAHPGPQPGPGGGHAPRPSDAVVPQHVVVGSRGRQADAVGRARWRRDRRDPPGPRRLPPRGGIRAGRDQALPGVLRERDQPRTHRWRPGRHAVPQGRHQRPRRRWRSDGRSERQGDEGGGLVPADRSRRWQRRTAAAAAQAGSARDHLLVQGIGRPPWRRVRRHHDDPGKPRRTRSTRISAAPVARTPSS